MSQSGQYALGIAGSSVLTLTGDVGGAVGPTLGNIDILGSAGITVTGDALGSSLTISGTGATAWTEVTGTSQSMAVDNNYIANNAGLVTLTLPLAASIGALVRVTGKGAGGWRIAQNAGQTIFAGTATTTTGVGGSLASTQRRDTVELVCVTANSDWNLISSIGNITVV